VRKNGTTVGSAGAQTRSGNTELGIGTGDTGLNFFNQGDAICPVNMNNGFDRDGAIDLGRSGSRFKDLYLSGGVNIFNGSTDSVDIRATGSRCEIDNPAANSILLKTGGTERVRIDSTGLTSSGKVYVNQASSASHSGGAIFQATQSNANWMSALTNSASSGAVFGLNLYFSGQAPNNTTSAFLAGADTGAERFRIFSNGNIVNVNNSYGASSDVKLKENIVDAESQWDDIKALTVRKYSMKADELDAPNMLGVIAQEVETAGMGGLVFESPDIDSDHNDLGTVTKAVNYSILYMKAVKALQEAMTRIETLETKVTALETIEAG
jgi:hypothetical protein